MNQNILSGSFLPDMPVERKSAPPLALNNAMVEQANRMTGTYHPTEGFEPANLPAYKSAEEFHYRDSLNNGYPGIVADRISQAEQTLNEMHEEVCASDKLNEELVNTLQELEYKTKAHLKGIEHWDQKVDQATDRDEHPPETQFVGQARQLRDYMASNNRSKSTIIKGLLRFIERLELP